MLIYRKKPVIIHQVEEFAPFARQCFVQYDVNMIKIFFFNFNNNELNIPFAGKQRKSIQVVF